MSPAPYLHVSVDFQGKYLRYLPLSRRAQMEKDMAELMAAEQRLPAVWVAFGKEQSFYAGGIETAETRTQRYMLVGSLGLGSAPIAPSDSIFVKGNTDAFFDMGGAPSGFDFKLIEHFPDAETLLITGMNTGACVTHTLASALTFGYRCIALENLLADAEYPTAHAGWQAEFLRRRVKQALEICYRDRPDLAETLDERLICMTSADFLALQNEKPAPPAKAAPVLNLQRRFG